jgi:hypothetical protein
MIRWEDLPPVPESEHSQAYVDILTKHGIAPKCAVPLIGRVKRGRKVTQEDLDTAYQMLLSCTPLTVMCAMLRRHPRDMFTYLSKLCKERGTKYRQFGLRHDGRWNEHTKMAAQELFDAGLPSWRIAVLFGLDVELAGKFLFRSRKDYGHARRNDMSVYAQHKLLINERILREIQCSAALDAFAGYGHTSTLIEDAFPNAYIASIEKDPQTFEQAKNSRVWGPTTVWYEGDNLDHMSRMMAEGRKFDLIDLDPFVSCRQQFDLTWGLLSDKAWLFVTLGGEFQKCWIHTNRVAISKRYGFTAPDLPNETYKQVMPAFFLGWVATQAAMHGFTFDVLRAVRYASICRFWTQIRKDPYPDKWLSASTDKNEYGISWRDSSQIARFSDIREMDMPT